jgi:hypothetical protein
MGFRDLRVSRRRFIRPLVLGLGLSLALGVGVSIAASQSGPLVPGGTSVAGHSYGQWVAAAWRWRLSLPAVTSNKTSCLTKSQHGPVWFLGESASTSTAITETCAIPGGRYLMFYTPSYDCSTVERAPFHATTNAGLRRCAKAWWQYRQGFLRLTLDGVNLVPAGYYGGTRVFNFKMPAHNNWLHAPGHTHGRIAVYGSASILRPLSPGSHTLVQFGGFSGVPSSYEKTTYKLTVS